MNNNSWSIIANFSCYCCNMCSIGYLRLFYNKTISTFAGVMGFDMSIDNKLLGRRIAELRQVARLSQEKMAKMIGVSRSVYAQIELGNRTIAAVELADIAEILNFSLDDILSDGNMYKIPVGEPMRLEDPGIRISVPDFNLSKFRNLILYILERCAGKANMGETVLYKLLYFSDFNYYELYEEHLSGASYKKWAKGPVPRDINMILHNMELEGMIQSFSVDYFGYKQKRYMPLVNCDKRVFNGAEIDVIDRVIDQLSDMSASQISQYSHGDMPWKASNDRQVIDYELVFYREFPYSVRCYGEQGDGEC